MTTIEARGAVSGKSGGTSWHLSSALDVPCPEIAREEAWFIWCKDCSRESRLGSQTNWRGS